MMFKIINNDQVEYLARNDAIYLLNNDDNFKRNKYLEIPMDWYHKFDEGIKNILNKVKKEIEKNPKYNRTKIDDILFDFFQDIELDPKIAAIPEFWGSLTIQHPEARELVKIRWHHDKNWFAEEIPCTKNIENTCRRYAGNDIDRQTFARIWWISKLVPKEKKEVVLKQQDFLDKALQNRYLFWGIKENNKLISRTMIILLECLEEFDKKKATEKAYENIQRQDVTRQVFNWLKILNDTTVIELLDDDELKETIQEFFSNAVSPFIDEYYFG